jgi:hypothetical protein
VIDAGATTSVEISWRVGGAVTVDRTSLHYGCVPDLSLFAEQDPTQFDEVIAQHLKAQLSPRFSGGGLWSASQPDTFSYRLASFPQCSSHEGTPFLMVLAEVDSLFGEAPVEAQPPNTPPQSHFANARTNSHWVHSISSTQMIVGHTVWHSSPIFIRQLHKTVALPAFYSPPLPTTQVVAVHSAATLLVLGLVLACCFRLKSTPPLLTTK